MVVVRKGVYGVLGVYTWRGSRRRGSGVTGLALARGCSEDLGSVANVASLDPS